MISTEPADTIGARGPEPSRVHTASYDNEGRAKSPHLAPISVERLFRPGRRTLRLRDSHSFTQGDPHQLGGGFTEVRTVEVTIRKLR